jgi:OmpA-OmpF porin, OOP family
MKPISVWGLFFILALTTGCTTKKYVVSQVTPILDKVNRLDQETARNTHAIAAVDTNQQQELAALNTKVAETQQKADAASNQANTADQAAAKANTEITSLTQVIVNLDNYHSMNQTSVSFKFNNSQLDPQATASLDKLVSQINDGGNYILTVEGGTDAVGNKDYNYDLSERRAAMVSSYLASKHNVPAFRIYAIGLGSDQPVADNQSAAGRAQNRRVTVVLMTTGQANAATQSTALK